MTEHDEREPLTPDEARFVARVSDAFAPSEPTPADRARFHARLEERLARRSRPALVRWLAPATLAAAAAALLVIARGAEVAPDVALTPQASSQEEEETFLALVSGEAAVDDSALPEDYQAIASLMY
jgi:hypothetical protein